MHLADMTSWKDIPVTFRAGFLASIVAVTASVYVLSDNFIVTEAEAAQQHQSFYRWRAEDLQKQMADVKLAKVQIKYRQDMSPQAKDEVIAAYDVKLQQLERQIACLDSGKPDCI